VDRRVGDEVFGFHCQQAVDKLLKAVLASKAIAYRRTHDLEALFELLEQAGTPLPEDLRESNRFTGFAVEYRYTDWPVDAGPLDREMAMSLITRIRRWAEDQIE
jgi:HEPN domain-containing protein